MTELKEIYKIVDSVRARDNTSGVRLWSLSPEEYLIYRSKVLGSAMKLPIWKVITKVSILGAGSMYEYLSDRDIESMNLIRLSLRAIVGWGYSDINVPCNVLVNGGEARTVRMLNDFIDWIDGNIVRVIGLSRSMCVRISILMGISRLVSEGVYLPEWVINTSKGVEGRFVEYVNNLRVAYESDLFVLFKVAEDVLKTVDLKKYWGVTYDEFIKVANICGFEYK